MHGFTFLHWFHSIYFISDNLVSLFGFTIPSLMKNISIINIFLIRGQLCHMNWLWWKSLCTHIAHTLISCFRKMSAAFNGIYNFDAWDISHEFLMTFMKKVQVVLKKQIQWREKFVKPFVMFRTVFILQLKFSLHWKGSMMKLWAKFNQERRKQNCITTLWESLFFWRYCCCKLNKDIAWALRIKSTLASNILVTKHLIIFDLWELSWSIASIWQKLQGKLSCW